MPIDESIYSMPGFLQLLQLVSPALPVGAYTYSEGLETCVQAGHIHNPPTLKDWLIQELRYGSIRIEAALLAKSYRYATAHNLSGIQICNQQLSALRETEEFRAQSWQMGRSLSRLLQDLHPDTQPLITASGSPCNFAVVFAIAASYWQITLQPTVLGYLHSWISNLINAGIRLIPLGQTQGQQLLLALYPYLEETVHEVLALPDNELWSCSWGLSIASMNHETLYSRLFRS